MLSQYRKAIFFLVKYVALYIALNLLYSFYIASYSPGPDAVTRIVTEHTALFLSLWNDDIATITNQNNSNIPILMSKTTIVEVYEGCNSINVMIVYVAFIFAFQGPLFYSIAYLGVGLLLIYIINILRVAGLFGVALHFPDHLYFFHKFFFTGIIYSVVFVLWYLWVQKVKAWPISERTN